MLNVSRQPGSSVPIQGREKVERKRGGKIAKVATARKLLEWIYHVLRDGKSFQEVERVVEAIGRGEPAKRPGLILWARENDWAAST